MILIDVNALLLLITHVTPSGERKKEGFRLLMKKRKREWLAVRTYIR